MEKLKPDIGIIGYLNRLGRIAKVMACPGEIVGEMNKETTTADGKGLNQSNALIDSDCYIPLNGRLVCIERFNV